MMNAVQPSLSKVPFNKHQPPGSPMAFFELAKNGIKGKIKVKDSNAFGFFSMEEMDVRKEFQPILDLINSNIKAKQLEVEVRLCRFVDHDGIDYHYSYN